MYAERWMYLDRQEDLYATIGQMHVAAQPTYGDGVYCVGWGQHVGETWYLANNEHIQFSLGHLKAVAPVLLIVAFGEHATALTTSTLETGISILSILLHFPFFFNVIHAIVNWDWWSIKSDKSSLFIISDDISLCGIILILLTVLYWLNIINIIFICLLISK